MWKIWINRKQPDGTSKWKEMCSSNFKPYLYESKEHAEWSARCLYPLATYGVDVDVSQEEPVTPAPDPSKNPFALTII